MPLGVLSLGAPAHFAENAEAYYSHILFSH
jgi:hypothetical protein